LTITCRIFAGLRPKSDRCKSRIPFFFGSSLGIFVMVVPGGGARTSSLPSVFFSSAFGASPFVFAFGAAPSFGASVFFVAACSFAESFFTSAFFSAAESVLASAFIAVAESVLGWAFGVASGFFWSGFGGVSSFFALRPGMVKSRLG